MMNQIAEIYKFAAELFLYKPDRRRYQEITECLSKNRWYISKSTKNFLTVIWKLTKDSLEEWTAFQEEYSGLVYNTDESDISLWESTYRSEKERLLDGNTWEVQQIYLKRGLRPVSSFHQIDDYIGFEFAFAAFLSYIDSEEIRREREEFLKNHLGFLLENVIKKILQNENRKKSRITALLKSLLDIVGEHLSGKLHEDESDCEKTQEDAISYVNQFFYTIPKEQPVTESKINSSGRSNCGGRCVFQATVKNGNLLKMQFDSKKTPCIKYCIRGPAYHSTFLSHRRLRYPMKRTGKRGEGKFERITWEEAVRTITLEWKRITRQYGPQSRYVNYSSGVSAAARPDLFAKRLLALDGGYLSNYNSYSSACAEAATPYVYGTIFSGNSSQFFKKSKCIILWAHNPKETLFGAYFMDELINAKKSGSFIIVIDPRYSATAEMLADEWIPIKPGTDSALMDAMAFVILSEGLEDRKFMDKFCLGFDEKHMPEKIEGEESYESYLFGRKDGLIKNPEWAEKITGIKKEKIRWLARKYAGNKPSALIQGLGAQRHSNGEQSVRGGAMLACLTGNVGIEGGYASGMGFIKSYEVPVLPMPENPYKASIPSFLWTDGILRGEEMTAVDDGVRGVTKLKSSIKMILNLAGNTLINQHSNIKRTEEILKDTDKCEFIVVSDVFMTSSAKFADILLPAPSFLESPNITAPWREGDYLLYNNPVAAPLFESRFEYEWLKEVAGGLGLYDQFTEEKENVEEWLSCIYEECRKKTEELPEFLEFQKEGGYFYKRSTDYIAFREQIEDFDNHPFPTPSGKIEIFSERLYGLHNRDIPAIPGYVPGFEGSEDEKIKKYPFQLIGWHTKRRCHSIHDNNLWLDKTEEPFVCINEEDAGKLKIKDGNMTTVWNDRGEIRLKARVTDKIMRGVLAAAQGAWYRPDEEGIDFRGNINVLATHIPTPLAKGNPQHSNLVDIRAI